MRSEDRIVLTGAAVSPTGMLNFQANLGRDDEWMFVEKIGSTVQMWSGKACEACQLTTGGLKRCALHANLFAVALQLRFIRVSS